MACSSSSGTAVGTGGAPAGGTAGPAGTGGASLGTGGSPSGTGGGSGTSTGGSGLPGAGGSSGDAGGAAPQSGTGGGALGGARANGGGAGNAVGGMAGRGSGGATTPTGGATASTFAVVTDRYDIARSGSNLNETTLTTSNVTAARFGLLFSRTISGDVYAQPLYVGGLTVNGAVHNVVYVATGHDMVYAFDADAATPDVPLWSKSLGAAMTLGAGADYDPMCTDMRKEAGISSTPVISVADGKLFVVAKTATDQQLHALDLATGNETTGSPVSVGRTAMPAFDPQIHLNRPGLLLLNGVVYIAFGSHCDNGAYHGWIFGYDSKTLALKSAYNSTPTGTQGAIWHSGMGLSSDGTDIWSTVGNGTSGSGLNMGNNVVRLTPAGAGLTVTAHYQSHVLGDNDLQSGAPLLGTTGQVVGGGKDGDILLLGQADLSLKQQLHLGGEVNTFAYWNGSAGPTLFAWTTGDVLRGYRVGAGTLTPAGVSTGPRPGHPSAIFTVSSNRATAGTGIVWASVPNGDAWHMPVAGTLYAFDATNPGSPALWNSGVNAQDAVGTFAKFSPPIVANGKVYLATFSGKLQVYGLK